MDAPAHSVASKGKQLGEGRPILTSLLISAGVPQDPALANWPPEEDAGVQRGELGGGNLPENPETARDGVFFLSARLGSCVAIPKLLGQNSIGFILKFNLSGTVATDLKLLALLAWM